MTVLFFHGLFPVFHVTSWKVFEHTITHVYKLVFAYKCYQNLDSTLGASVSICKRQSYFPKQDTTLTEQFVNEVAELFFLRWEISSVRIYFLFFHNLAPQHLQVILKHSLLPIISNFIATYSFIKTKLRKRKKKKKKFHLVCQIS